MKRRPTKRRLRLEPLEVRALLAADVGSDLAHALSAVQGSTAIDAAFAPSSGNHLLELTGHGTEALVIDLDRLPSFVTKLFITDFASVTMTGSDKVEDLVATNVESLVAPGLSINESLFLHDVGSAELASGGRNALLWGSKNTELSVRSLEGTTIFSDLQVLTLDSETKVLTLDMGPGSAQTILKYHPESVNVSGESNIRFLDEGSSPPISDPVGSDPGTSIIPPSSNPTGEIGEPETAITIIAKSEASRAFIAELRESLHTSPKDSQRLVLEFLNHATADASTASPTTSDVRHAYQANPRELEGALQGRQLVVLTSDVVESLGVTDTVPLATAQIGMTDKPVDRPFQLPQSRTSAASEPTHTIEIDATWPVAMAPQQGSENPRPFAPLSSTQVTATEPNLEDSLRAFTDYVVDRVAAEFSPGQQSLVLLVDPKPTRSGAVNQNSALDLFGSRTLTSIASLRQVMS